MFTERRSLDHVRAPRRFEVKHLFAVNHRVELEHRASARHPIQTQAHRATSYFVLALLTAYCFLGAAHVIVASAHLLHNPWENANFEAPQVYAAIHTAETGELYVPMSVAPYTPQPYAPVYYAIGAGVAKLADFDLDRVIYDLRLLTFIAYLLCGLLVFLICRAAELPPHYSFLSALMMVGQPDFLVWNVAPRPDLLFLLAMLMSLYFAVKYYEHAWLGFGFAGIAAGVAVLIKQPGFAVAIAIFAALIFQKQFKKAAIFVAGCTVPVVLTLAILYWRHDPFLQQALFAVKSSWSIRNAAQFARTNLLTWYWIVPTAIGLLGFVPALKSGAKGQLIASFALFNFMVGLSGLPQLGGYVNYLLPAMAGCAMLLPYAIQVFEERTDFNVASSVIATLALSLAMLTGYLHVNGVSHVMNAPSQEPLTFLRPYRVLSDLTTMNLHGREPNLLDPFGARVMELNGYWDPSPVVEGLRHGDYDLIILTRVDFHHVVPNFRGISYFSPMEVKLINANYEVLCSTMTNMVLRPRGRDVSATPEMFGRMFNQTCPTGWRKKQLDLKLDPEAH